MSAIYLQQADLDTDNFKDGYCVDIKTTQHHYLINVLRKKCEDDFLIFNGKGTKYKARIKTIEKQFLTAEIEDTTQQITQKNKLSLAISVLKNIDRFEWFLEKATELGVSEIIPFVSEKSERKNLNQQRAENILISAMLQSQRFFLPRLNPLTDLKHIFKRLNLYKEKYATTCNKQVQTNPLNRIQKNDHNTVFFVGPEGDFSITENQRFTDHHFKFISLGDNRLRTETAGVFICSYFYNLYNV